MKLRTKQSGFSIIEIVIVLVVLGIIGFLGYAFYNNQMHKTATNDNAQTTTAQDVQSAPTISKTSDLDTAATILDQADLSSNNSSDASQLDSELANF